MDVIKKLKAFIHRYKYIFLVVFTLIVHKSAVKSASIRII